MMSPTSRVGLPTLINLIETTHHRHAQKFIFKVVLDPVKLNNPVNSPSPCTLVCGPVRMCVFLYVAMHEYLCVDI